MDQIRVLIADDHAVVRAGLNSIIGMQKDMIVVGLAKDGVEAVAEARRLKPDAVVMDLMMPRKDGAQATAEIHKELPETKIVILTTFGTADILAHALDNGASGAVLKDAAEDELVTAIRQAMSGKRHLSSAISHQLRDNPPLPELSQRQRQILAAMARGLTNRDIAAELGLSLVSVEEYAANTLKKLGAANRTEAVAIALRKHLLKI